MFTYAYLNVVRRDGKPQGPYHCAVCIEDGMVIHFGGDGAELACRGAIADFNAGVGDPPSGYNMVKPSECVYVKNGERLVPTLDGPVETNTPEIVNVLGLDYLVPKPVADYLATVKAALTAACIRANDAEKAADEALAALMDQTTDRF